MSEVSSIVLLKGLSKHEQSKDNKNGKAIGKSPRVLNPTQRAAGD